MAAIIPKRVLETIRFQNDIAEVISSYITLKRAGSAFKACCPFHNEKTPSFHVNPQRQIFHCFGCGVGGDVFAFLMKYEGVTFTSAAKLLAQRAGIEVQLEEDGEAGSDKATLFEIHSEVARLYHTALLERNSAQPARDYLKQRHLSEETTKEFQIGYAPARWDSVLNWMKNNKHKMDIAEQSGLIMKSSKEGAKSEHYDRFRNRLMFPIFDEQNRVIAFSGRTMSDDSKEAKYVNSPETPLFHKSRILYAMNKARQHIVKTREVIVCEGQIDVIRCHQAGFNTAVASQGTAFTEDHVRILKRYADSACIVFDPDKAGQDAAIRTATLFMSNGLAVRVATLPDNEDPDSYILKHGAEAFQSIIDNAESAVKYQINVLSSRENTSSEIGVMRISKEILKTITHSPNAVQRAKLVQEAADMLNLPASALQDDLKFALKNKGSGYRTKDPAEQTKPASTPTAPITKVERELCEHIVNIIDCPELKPIINDYLPLSMIASPICHSLILASLKALEGGTSIQETLRNEPEYSEELHQFAAQVQMTPSKITGNEFSRVDAVKDLILCIWRQKLEMERETAEDTRRRQITYDLKTMLSWEDGSKIIELEIEE